MNLSAIDLNLLVVLHAILEEGSAARAARRLHVTPPAISNSLARLRALLGDPLFVRSGRGLVPTPRAVALRPALARMLADAARIVEGSEQDPAATTRELAIALTDADQIASLPRLAEALGRRMPHAGLRVISVDTLISRGGLEGGAAELAIGPEDAAVGLHSAPLYREDGVLVVRRRHPITRARAKLKDAFGSLRHVDVHLALGRGGVGHRAAQEALAKEGLARDIAVTVPSFTAAAMLAASTDLAAGMPRRLAEALAPMAKLAILEMPLPPFQFGMRLIWHERTHHDPVAARFRETVLEALAEPKALARR